MVFPRKNGCNNVTFGVFPPLAKYSIQAKQGRSHSRLTSRPGQNKFSAVQCQCEVIQCVRDEDVVT